MTTLKEARKIENRLRWHHMLMETMIKVGVKREDASKAAFELLADADRRNVERTKP